MTENSSTAVGREQVSVTINDQQVGVAAGCSILDAARHVGIDIPRLCHQEGKSDSPRPCLMCLVEVDGERKRACRTTVAAGMVIETDTPELIAHRKERLQELAGHHYGDCKAPCTLTCPGGINVQGYINLIAKGEFEAALRLIKERNALPGIVCRVCPRFCETRCRRILLDEALSINHLKRFAVDHANLKGGFTEEVGEPSGHKVAIIGGGPAGLSCAYYLRKQGHEVYIFEADTRLGGLARYGIPNFKMPDYELDREIETIIGMGVQIRTGKEWGRDFNLADLRNDGFEAIFIASGMSQQIPLDVPGKAHIWDGLSFLRHANSGERIDVGSKVMVVGGTKISIHAARSARRLGDVDVTVLYPRAKVEMPASQRDIDEAEKEGVQFFMMATPLGLAKTDAGRLRMEIARTVLSEPDKRGKRKPIPMEGSLLIWEGDLVINGFGQMSDGAFAGFGEIEAQLSLSPKKAIKSNPSTMATNVPGIYAGGEAATGARSVIQAVDSGRRAAEAIHKEMTGNPVPKPADGRLNFSKGKKFEDVDMANFTGSSVALAEAMPARPPERRIRDFDQVETGFSVEMAVREAKRCLQCGCTGLSKCTLRPLAIEHKVPAKLAAKRLQCQEKTDHPSIRIDANKCVLCYRCERVCPYGAITLSFKEEEGTVIDKDITINEKCVSCGVCVDACPTGTLMKNHLVLPLLPGEADMTNSVCTYCGTGCATEIYTKNNVIFEIKGDAHGPSNHGELCVKGRFGFDFYNSPERLTQPLLRESNEAPFRKVSWYEALGFIADKLKDYQGDRFAALASARCTNEDNYLLQKFTRSVMGTNSIDHCARL